MWKRVIKKILVNMIKEVCESKDFQAAAVEFIKASSDLNYSDAEKSAIWNKLMDALINILSSK